MTENGAALRTYSYDNAGNIVTDVRPSETFAYTYNKRNRLSSVTRNGVAYATYTYNALEQLTSRTTSAAGGPVGTLAMMSSAVWLAQRHQVRTRATRCCISWRR